MFLLEVIILLKIVKNYCPIFLKLGVIAVNAWTKTIDKDKID